VSRVRLFTDILLTLFRPLLASLTDVRLNVSVCFTLGQSLYMSIRLRRPISPSPIAHQIVYTLLAELNNWLETT